MAWTSLTYPFGSILTSAKMAQNQDNFLAVANGATNAPKIQTAAINDNAVTLAKLGAAVYTTDTDYQMGKISGDTASTSYVKVGGVLTATVSGQYNLRVEISMAPTTGTMGAQIYKNGAPYGTLRTSTAASAGFNEDLALAVGDKVEIYAAHSTGGATVTAVALGIATDCMPMGGHLS